MSLLNNVRLNFGAFLVGKLFAAVVGLLLPRLLGPEGMGAYTSAWGLAMLVSVVSDLGLQSYLTREVSRDREHAGTWLYRAGLVQLAQVLMAALSLALIYELRGQAKLDGRLVILGFLPSALASLSNPLNATLQGLEQYRSVSRLISLTSMLNALFLGAALYWNPVPSLAFAAAAISGSLGLVVWIVAVFRLKLSHVRPRLGELQDFFRGALPFALVSAANLLYVRADLALLTWMSGAAALGQYGAAVKCVDPLVPLLGALGGPLYPRLSRSFAEGGREGSESLRRGLRYLTALCLPLGIGGSLLATPLMRWLYGSSFAPAGLAFAWLIWVPALNGIHGLMLHAMNALGKTRLIAAIFFANLLINVALNLALVPRYGYVASAALSALCEVVVMLAVLWILKREGMDLGLGRMLWPSVPAAALMAFALLALPEAQGWQTPLWVFLGALIYAVALAALGFFGTEERGHLKRLLGRAG